MKKHIAILIIILALFSLSSCDSSRTKIFRTNFGYEHQPTRIFRSVKDIEVYKNNIRNTSNNDLEYIENKLKSMFFNYDDTFFTYNLLFVAVFVEASGSIHHSVKKIEYVKNTMKVTVVRTVPETGSCDMAEWHLLIEVSLKDFKGEMGEVIVETESEITSLS